MTTKSDFSSSEWQQLISAPHHIYSVLSGVDRESLLMKRKEAKALDKFMEEYGSGTGLVKQLIADEGNADDSKATVDEAYDALEAVGKLLDSKAADSDGDAVRTFLLKAAKDVSEAVAEGRGLFKSGGEVVSENETEAIERIEKALKATSADARRRRSAAASAAAGATAAAGAAAAAKSARSRAASTSSDAAEIARQKAEVARRAAARKAAKATAASSSTDAEAARQKAEVAARAAKRRAAKEAEEAQKAAVEQRAAQRRAAKEAEEAAAKAEAQRKARAEAERKAKAERERKAAEKARQERRAKAAAEAAAAKAAAEMRTYTVVSGDTLSGISLKMYGTANKWRGIFEANSDTVKDPSLIYPGQVLKIPDQE